MESPLKENDGFVGVSVIDTGINTTSNTSSPSSDNTFTHDEIESASILQNISTYVERNKNEKSSQQDQQKDQMGIVQQKRVITEDIDDKKQHILSLYNNNNNINNNDNYTNNDDVFTVKKNVEGSVALSSTPNLSLTNKNSTDELTSKRKRDDLSDNGSDDGSDDDSGSECSNENKNRKSTKKKRVRHPVYPLWTVEEDELIMEKNTELGNDWAKICTFLPGRSRVDVKVRYKSIVSAEKKLWNVKDDEKIFNLYRIHNADWKTISTYFQGRTKNAVRVRYKELKRLTFQPVRAPSLGSAKQIFYKRSHPHFHRDTGKIDLFTQSTNDTPISKSEAEKGENKIHQESKCEKCSNCKCCSKQDHHKETSTTTNKLDDIANSGCVDACKKPINTNDIPSVIGPHNIYQAPPQFMNNFGQVTLGNGTPSPLIPSMFQGVNWNTPPSVVRFPPQYMYPQAPMGARFPFAFPALPQIQFPSLMNPKGI